MKIQLRGCLPWRLRKVVPEGGKEGGKLIPNRLQKVVGYRPVPAGRQKIEVLGPPPTSGTRDAFVELAMEKRLQDLQAP